MSEEKKRDRGRRAFLAAAGAAALVPSLALAATGTASDPWILGMSQCNLGEPWRVQMNADIKKAAEARSTIRVVYKDASLQEAKALQTLAKSISLEPHELLWAGLDCLMRSQDDEDFIQAIIGAANERFSNNKLSDWTGKLKHI